MILMVPWLSSPQQAKQNQTEELCMVTEELCMVSELPRLPSSPQADRWHQTWLAMQRVTEQHQRHQVVCRDGLSPEDHPDQGVIAHLQPVSACRRNAGDQEISSPSPCTKSTHGVGNKIFLRIAPQTHTCLQLKKSSRYYKFSS